MRVPRLIFFRSFNFSIQSVPYSSTHSSIPFIYTRAHTYVIQPVPYRTESEKSTSLNEIHVGTGTVLKPWHGIHFIASLFQILNTRARAHATPFMSIVSSSIRCPFTIASLADDGRRCSLSFSRSPATQCRSEKCIQWHHVPNEVHGGEARRR